MPKYDHILAKQSDIQYKLMMSNIAVANELNEINRMKRIEVSIEYNKLSEHDKMKLESLIEEEVDFTDNA